MARLNKKVESKPSEEKDFTPFDKVNKLHQLKMFVIIVPSGQANGVVKILNELESAMNLITNGEGTYQRESQLSGPKKQIIFTFLKEEMIPEFKERIAERFHVSSAAKGIAFSIKLTSVAGVSVYKFLSNTKEVEKL